MGGSLILKSVVGFLILFALGAYFLIQGNDSDDLIAQKNKLQKDFSTAKDKLNKEQQTLDSMIDGLSNSFPFAVSIQGQMKRASDIIEETNFMFTDAEGLNPELIIKRLSSLTFMSINNERKDINLLLKTWREEVGVLSVRKIDINEAEKIKKDAETIRTYIEDLREIIGNLTPTSSGLSQYQIDTYLSQLPSINVINEVLISIQDAIEGASSDGSQSFSSQTMEITPEDVVAEQQIVLQAQTEVLSIQEQLQQIEQQIIQQSTPPPTTVTTPTSTYTPIPTNTDTTNTNTTTTDPDLNNQETNNTNETNNYVSPYQYNGSINYQGIIIQPGPPRLIQGTDPY